MGFLAKLLGTVGSGGWIIYAVLAAAVFGAGTTSGAWVVHRIDAPTFAGLKTACVASGFKDTCAPADIQAAQDAAKLDAQKARTAYSEQQKQTALDLAAANAAALAQNQALAAKAASLGAALATAERARQTASTKLLDTLKAIPHDQQTALPPSSRAYLRGVLDAQTAAAGTTPANNPN